MKSSVQIPTLKHLQTSQFSVFNVMKIVTNIQKEYVMVTKTFPIHVFQRKQNQRSSKNYQGSFQEVIDKYVVVSGVCASFTDWCICDPTGRISVCNSFLLVNQCAFVCRMIGNKRLVQRMSLLAKPQHPISNKAYQPIVTVLSISLSGFLFL